jgi:two-component system NtrC family sensor kinase
MEPSVKPFRHLVLILLFSGLVSLEIWHGVFRLSTLSRRQRSESVEAIRRRQRELALSLGENLRAERDHARYLVKMARVRGLLRAAPDSPAGAAIREELSRDLLPYLLSFPVIDRMALYDPAGRERFRMMRSVDGAGALPEGLLGGLDERIWKSAGALLSLGQDEVALSDLQMESGKVEVPENDRQVLRYAALVREREETVGVLVLTLYAAPLLDAVRSWRPGPGAVSALIDGEGRFLAHPDRARERSFPRSLLAEHPRAGGAVLRGAEEVAAENGLLLSTPVPGGLPGWRLLAEVGESSLEASALPIRGEYAWVIGSMAATALLLIVSGAFLLRLSVREVRLAEEGRYLERIRRESARYRALMEGAADMILIVSPERGVIREANGLARRALGLPQGEAPLEAVLSPAHAATFRERLQAAAAGGSAELPEIRLLGERGKEIPASGRLAAIDLGDERVVEVALRDLSREKEMERQVRISERLGSLGLLTAGVAHEINNPLEGIENYLALLEREGGDGARRARYLEMVRYGFRRIRDIVRDLSSFARPEVKGETADLAQVVERALGMVRYDHAFRTVEVERRGLDRPLVVPGDPGRLEQVFINLLVNAGRAMGSHGKVAIAARETEGGAEPAVEVVVEDEGPGIPEESLGRIFDPFYTTGDGSGLGLSISYGIIRAHGGDIRAENRPEGGARFTLRLPGAAGGPAGAESELRGGRLRPPAGALSGRSGS